MTRQDAAISGLRARAYKVPTDQPEADGTFSWTQTTLVLVELTTGDTSGLGFTYADACLVELISDTLDQVLLGCDPLNVPHAMSLLRRQVRNLGRGGLCACALSAIDAALWDLKSKLLGLPLCRLLGCMRTSVPVYGSGGFTSYSDEHLRRQLAAWVQDGCTAVKMKIGTERGRDPARVRAARSAIGTAELFVDANGAYDAATALAVAHELTEDGPISWFEEPVTSDDADGLLRVREGAPVGMSIAAGEYVYTLDDARHLLDRGAVDVLQADVTRCGGISGFLAVASLCEADHLDLSGHCAPAMHRHVACAAPRLRHLEWFHDHVRIEHLLFEGAPQLRNGMIAPDLREPGHGLRLREQDAAPYLVRERRAS